MRLSCTGRQIDSITGNLTRVTALKILRPASILVCRPAFCLAWVYGLSRVSSRSKVRSAASLPKLKELAQLGKGDYRLHWHGAFRPSIRYPYHGHKAEALFTSLDDPSVARVVTLPLGTFPHLALGTVWSDGVYDGHDVLDTKTVRIAVPRQKETAWRDCRLSDVMPEAIYPSHGLANPAGCFLIPTDGGEELIVPYAEILRAWYFFDSAVIPAIISGAITRPSVMPHKFLPWVPELSARVGSGAVRIVHKNRLSVSSAKCLARLLFDDVARRRTVDISQSIRVRIKDPAVHLPAALPPFYGPAVWIVRCYQVENVEGTAKRYMVQQLLSSDDPVPYDRLERLSLADLRPGSKRADELEPIIRRITRNIFEDDGVTELSGNGPDDSLDKITLAGLGFRNSALQVPTVLPEKGEQTHTGVPIDGGDARVNDGSVDPTAESTPGTPPTTVDQEPKAAEAPEIHNVDIAAAFKKIVETVAAHPDLAHQGWRGDFPFEKPKVKVRNEEQEKDRSFVIARVTNDLRNIYLMDAEPHSGEKLGRLIAFEVKSGVPLSESHLQEWLGSFPSKPGCRWTNSASGSMQLNFIRMNHQPPAEGSEAKTFENFTARVVERILEIIS